MRHIQLGSLFADRVSSIDPQSYPNETFELWSIPAFDAGKPDIALGSSIGSTKKCIEPNDVLLSKIIPHIRRATVVPENRGLRQIASSEWIIFRSPDVWPAYLRHVLISDRFHEQFMNTTAGVGGSLVRARPDAVGKISIPLPLLDEQRRIAATLDQADNLRRKGRLALDKLNTVPQAFFREMFGDPAINPRQWPMPKLGDMSTRFSDGPFGSNLRTADYVNNGVRVIRLQNIGLGEFRGSDAVYVSESHFARLKKHECFPGDVLIATLGEPNLRACKLPDDISKALNKADCVQMRCNPVLCTAEYVVALLNDPSTELLAQSRILGQTRLRISMGRLRELTLPLPPLALQHIFSERIALVEVVKQQHSSRLAKLDALFATLQHRAFRGELLPSHSMTAIAV